MKRYSLTLALVLALVLPLAAGCTQPTATPAPPTSAPAVATTAPATAAPATATPENTLLTDVGLDENLRFTETRKITVEVFDRGLDGGKTPPEDNFYSEWIKEGVLRDHNIEVEFIPVPRWTEPAEIANLLAAGDAPDVCVTYQYPVIQQYANMDAVVDLGQYLDKYASILPNLWDWLGEYNLKYDEDPVKHTIWAIEAKLANRTRINTFVREDWLNELGLGEPTSLEEFEAVLRAFKDNAETLLGADAGKMIPFSTSFDVGWRINHITSAMMPSNISDRDFYVYGFDDRLFMQQNGQAAKAAAALVNKWYNEGLVWKDFALYGAGDTTEDNLAKAGYVGAFIHNWDYPYRDAENGITGQLHITVGDDANFIAVEPFKDDAGKYKKVLPNPVDRKVFFTATNDEPIASLLYLDWITKFENRRFLQIGEEGVTHEVVEGGAIKTLAGPGDKIMNSPNNIDYTITINGLELGDPELTAKSLALGYAGVDARLITKAFAASTRDGITPPHVQFGEIRSEEGMSQILAEKRDQVLNQSIVAPVSSFDPIWQSGYADYLSSGGQAIIDERAAKWKEFYGDASSMP